MSTRDTLLPIRSILKIHIYKGIPSINIVYSIVFIDCTLEVDIIYNSILLLPECFFDEIKKNIEHKYPYESNNKFNKNCKSHVPCFQFHILKFLQSSFSTPSRWVIYFFIGIFESLIEDHLNIIERKKIVQLKCYWNRILLKSYQFLALQPRLLLQVIIFFKYLYLIFYLLTYNSNMKIKEIGKYQIVALIGQGSFGKVYKGIQKPNNKQVALKFISRKGKTRRDMQNLKQQIEILKKLKHQNIIELKDHIQTQSQIILVTEFAGKDLSVVMEKQKKFKIEQIKNYMRQIVSALLYLYENRIVHRDLKPQNILIKQNVVKLCDFGFARKMSAATVCLYSLKGTPLYIAPQIISEKPYNHKIDIWSLGIILYELYTGLTPFYADTYYKLLPKILNDNIKYPKDINLELKELIDGMLIKNPNFRYDWDKIIQHPFLKKKIQPLQQLTENINNNNIPKQNEKSYLNFQNDFPLEVLQLKTSYLLNPNNKIEFEELRQYEEQIKRNPNSSICTDLKINLMFYHKMVTLFSLCSQGEKIGKEHLILAFRVISGLITKVKLSDHEKQQDITKRKDLLLCIIKLIVVIEQQDLLTQIYVMIGYLLKNNFDSIQIDEQASQQIIYSSSNILMKQKISINLFTNILKIIGILANQAMLTLSNSENFFIIIKQSKLLEIIASKINVQKQYSIVFECLQKFIHPIKGENNKLVRVFNSLKLDTAKGFVSKGLINFIKGVEGYTEFQYFFQVFYECTKISSEFRKQLLSIPSKVVINSLFSKNILYNLAINYILMKQQKTQLYNIQTIRQEITQYEWVETEICKLYKLHLIFHTLQGKPQSKIKIQLQKIIIKNVQQLLSLDQQIKFKSIQLVEGWAFGNPSYTFDQIITQIVTKLFQQQKTFSSDLMRLSTTIIVRILDNLIKIRNKKLNIPITSLFKIFLIVPNYIKEFGINKKFISNIIQSFHIILAQQYLMQIKQNTTEEYFTSFVFQVLLIIKQISNKDDKKLFELYAKVQNLNFYRVIFYQCLITQKILGCSLPILSKVLQKNSPVISDYLAVQGLCKLKKFFNSVNNQIIFQILQITSYLARSKGEYYPKINNLGIIQFVPRYLSSNVYNQSVKQKSLNLIGNLSKHSTYFFDDFTKHKILSYFPNIIAKANSFQKIIKNVIYAIGNISYYNQQFRSDIQPLLPYFYKALLIQDDHMLANNISTISNLLRHSNTYLKDLINSKIIAKIFEIIETAKNTNIILFSLGFLQKLIQFPEFFSLYPKEYLYKFLQKINVGNSETQAYKKYKKILQKLK